MAATMDGADAYMAATMDGADAYPETTTWKKEALFFFPSSMAIYLSREGVI
jgi:hypothetical protein